jgi:hypothetical protein
MLLFCEQGTPPFLLEDRLKENVYLHFPFQFICELCEIKAMEFFLILLKYHYF